jgi:uncharacterized protein YdiU (UPF0061 family)
MKRLNDLAFSNGFAELPEAFFTRVRPQPLQGAYLASFNASAAALIDLHPEAAEDPAFVELFGGSRSFAGGDPVATLYAGHQFGHYVPQLGDGRAILLGEVRNRRNEPWELQLKGAGLTPYSRDGDGRAVLRSSIREYLCSEAMHGLGIPTTRALCLIASTEEVYREQIETGAILVRMAPSHLRFGSFEVFYYRGQFHRLKELADHLLARHFPALAEGKEPYAELLRTVIRRTARLMAQWQLVGFAHGVMNTDNMSMLGLTLDYGPYGFMDSYEPGLVCNHSDRWGRYAFDRQPQVGLWNLSCLAQAMLPLLDADDGEAAAERGRALLQEYDPQYTAAYAQGMAAKLGLEEAEPADLGLAEALLRIMAQQGVDYARLFRALGRVQQNGSAGDAPARDLFPDRAAFDQWVERYRARLRRDGVDDDLRGARMDRVNPKYVLRNYLAQRAIEQAQKGDFGEVDRLLTLLQRPFDEQPQWDLYAAEPPDWGRRIAVSCSS